METEALRPNANLYRTFDNEEESEEVNVEYSESQSCLSRICTYFFPTGFIFELKSILITGVPLMLTNLLQVIIPMTSNIIAGHLSVNDFGGVSLANSIINGFGISVNIGLCTACDTLFSQGFGSTNPSVMGLILQKSLIINTLAVLIIIAFQINCEPIFVLLGQVPGVAEKAAAFMTYFAPGLFFQMQGLIVGRFLQNQNIVYPTLIADVIATIFNAILQYVTVYVLHYGLRGIALSQSVAFFLIWLLQVIYILATETHRSTWNGWSLRALEDWKSFLSLAIPGVGHAAFEEIIWEICMFIAGTIGAIELGAQSILDVIEDILFMIPLGFGVAVNIRVGQYLGGNNPAGAKSCVNTAFIAMTVILGTIAIIALTCSNYIAAIFTENEDIINLSTKFFYLLLISAFANALQGVANGAIRGCGRQIIGALATLFGFYLVGFPLTLILVYVVKMRLLGLWIGLLVGNFLMTFVDVSVILFTNWEHQAELAIARCGEMTTSENLAFEIENSPDDTLESMEKVNLVLKRLWQILLVLLFFSGSIVFKLKFPRDLYWPSDKNVTSIDLNL